MKKVILILASQGYQPVEYGHTRRMLEVAGLKVKVASDKTIAHAEPSTGHSKVCDDPGCRDIVKKHAEYANAPVDMLISNIKPNDYDGIFIIGGPGALEFLDNETTYNVMKAAAQANKPFGAICISPRILVAAGLLKGKKATGWDDDNELEGLFSEHGVEYLNEAVVTDGNLVTGNGPRAAKAFGKALVDALKNS